MSYVAVPGSVLEYKDPIRSVDITQMNDNTIDHEARLKALEAAPDSYVSSHFTRRSGYTSDRIITATSGTTTAQYEDRWLIGAKETGGATTYWLEGVSVDDALNHHIALFFPSGDGSSDNDWGFIQSLSTFNFTYATLPITFTTRVKLDHNDPTFLRIGLMNWMITADTAPTDGIFLERNGANFRFRTVNASTSTNGSDFAPPTADTWFEVEIIFTNSPSNQALCYVDGVLKDTLTGANLPTAKNLRAKFHLTEKSTTNTTHRIDRMSCTTAANVADLA